MTADAPMGEYLELVPKSAYDTDDGAPAPKRVLHPEIRDPIYRTSLQASTSAEAAPAAPSSAPASGPSLLDRRSVPRTAAPPPAAPTGAAGSAPREAPADRQTPPVPRARVLNPGKVPSWRSSSYDLLTGCTVRDVTDTIPGEIYDELFRSNSEPRTVRRRR
jgi:hypothetical protein